MGMTGCLVIGDIVRTETGHDIIIGFAPDDRPILECTGLADDYYCDVIGHWNDTDRTVTMHGD
jgi:hypothetical protein